MNTEERLANLEALLPLVERELAQLKRRNRRLLVFTLVAAGVTVVAAAWIGTPANVLAESAAKAPNVIRANGFILEDADGKVRAKLAVEKDGPRLDLYDENGKRGAGLGPTTAGAQAGGAAAPADVAADAARERAGIDTGTVTPEGKYIGPRPRTPEERAAAGEYVHPEVLHRYRLDQAKKQAELAVVNEVRARRFVLVDEAGRVRADLTAHKTGPELDFYDQNGKGRAALGVTKDGPGLLLLDENGKVVWTAGGALGIAASPGQATRPVEAAPPAPQLRSCPECGGSGSSGFACSSCNGRGNDGRFMCSFCKGKGLTNCWRCGGKGMVSN